MKKIIAITEEIPTPRDIQVNKNAKNLVVPLPPSSQILDVQPEAGGGTIKIYIEADEDEINDRDSWVRTRFRLLQTGDKVEPPPHSKLGYLGTVQIGTAYHTWHIYIVESKR